MSNYEVRTTAYESRYGMSNLVHEIVDRRTGKSVMKFEGLVGEATNAGDPSVPMGGDVKVELDADGKHVIVHEANGNTRRVPIGKR
jgi:hypothetical protein